MHHLAACGMGSLAGSITVAVLPTSQEWEAIAKVPVVLVLAGLAAWFAYLFYRQGQQHARSMDGHVKMLQHMSEGVHRLAEAINRKPCMMLEPVDVTVAHDRNNG